MKYTKIVFALLALLSACCADKYTALLSDYPDGDSESKWVNDFFGQEIACKKAKEQDDRLLRHFKGWEYKKLIDYLQDCKRQYGHFVSIAAKDDVVRVNFRFHFENYGHPVSVDSEYMFLFRDGVVNNAGATAVTTFRPTIKP